jgi:hypothetical protein
MAEDAYFAGDVAGVLARMPEAAMPAVPPPGTEDRGRTAALGGLAVAAAAALVLAIVLLTIG